jgi:predicted TIM-barrel fold metal-dependent hydrolase
MAYIDAHVHVWTPDTAHYPLAAGFKRDDMKPASFTPEQLMAHARPTGVDRIVLVQMSFYGFDNSYMLDTMKGFPGAYGGIAVVDWTSPKPDQAMLDLLEHGVRGFRIYPKDVPLERWVESAGFERMFAAGAESGQAMCCLINPDALPSLDRMCRRHPKTPVVIDHLCRIGVDGQVRDADVAALCRMAEREQVRVKVSAFYALGKKQPPYDDLAPMIQRVYEAYGAKRLMWATDCPYQVDDHTYADSVNLVKNRLAFLSDDDKKWILEKTAEGLFF